MLVSGAQAIEQFLDEGNQLERIYLINHPTPHYVTHLLEVAARYRVPVNRVPVEKLNSFNAGDHGGAVALKSRIRYVELQDIISFTVEQGQVPLFVMLDGVTDIRNIGGIARTAWCCGAHALIIPDKGVGALQDDAITASAGALEKIPVCRVSSLLQAIEELHLNGIAVFAAEMKASLSIFEADFRVPAAVVMGSEGAGITPALYKHCDITFQIPMQNDFESLNVSIATAMTLYEAMKQRMQDV